MIPAYFSRKKSYFFLHISFFCCIFAAEFNPIEFDIMRIANICGQIDHFRI